MCVFNPAGACLRARGQEQGWLLLVVTMILLLIALGVLSLMAQAQLSLKSVRQGHQATQEKIDQWPRLLKSRGYSDGQ